MADAILAAEQSNEIISRKDAIARGLKRYFTGEPCLHGHIAPRNVGASNECIECKRVRDCAYAASRKPQKSEYDKAYRERHAEELRECRAAYREKNKDTLKKWAKEDRRANPERYKGYREKSAEKRKASIKQWREKNLLHVAKYSARYLKVEKAKKSNVWLAAALRQRLAVAVRNGAKSGSAVRDLGCSIEELRSYLEKQFKQGMTWGNWGRNGWHIDHIKPLAAFDLSDPEQVKLACHYTNLQPLWSVENIAKGAKIA